MTSHKELSARVYSPDTAAPDRALTLTAQELTRQEQRDTVAALRRRHAEQATPPGDIPKTSEQKPSSTSDKFGIETDGSSNQ